MTTCFWPAADPAQVRYEALRASALAGDSPLSLDAARFARRGLVGLIVWPRSESVFRAEVEFCTRPAWSPSIDPRQRALVAALELLLFSPHPQALVIPAPERIPEVSR